MTVNPIDAGPSQVSRSIEVHAPAAELFAMVADPRRHHELDGSGTVRDNVRGPAPLTLGAKFSTKMKMFGMPYRITSTVTALQPDQLIEWRHPLGHRWRWEFAALSETDTRVTETFDYRGVIGVQKLFAKQNVAGIDATLSKLRDRYQR
jgi:uncharacterized protein YndB with AHSA1/START domain